MKDAMNTSVVEMTNKAAAMKGGLPSGVLLSGIDDKASLKAILDTYTANVKNGKLTPDFAKKMKLRMDVNAKDTYVFLRRPIDSAKLWR